MEGEGGIHGRSSPAIDGWGDNAGTAVTHGMCPDRRLCVRVCVLLKNIFISVYLQQSLGACGHTLALAVAWLVLSLVQ